jgi:hypothetical protein
MASSDNSHTRSFGRRIVIAIVPPEQAGGRTTWMRSPESSAAESNGDSALTRWWVDAATSREK